MKILCRANVTPEVMGYPSLEAIKADCEKYPHLRPCPKRRDGEKLGGWVYKTHCAKGRCKFFVKVIEEGDGDKKGDAMPKLQASHGVSVSPPSKME